MLAVAAALGETIRTQSSAIVAIASKVRSTSTTATRACFAWRFHLGNADRPRRRDYKVSVAACL